MIKIKGEEVYLFHQYINKIVRKYDEGLMDLDKFHQYLVTLGLWEVVFKRLSKSRQMELLPLLGWME